MTQSIANALGDKLGTQVKIEKIEVGLFNRLILHEVEIKDLQNQNLLKAGLMTAKIELRSLFKHQLALRTISLLDTDINLYKTSNNGPSNFQFIVDAFSGKEKKEKSDLDLRINSLILRRVCLNYHEHYKPLTPRQFNPAHLKMEGITANVSLKSITPNSIDLHVRSFALREQSGFELKELRFKLHANRTKASIHDFELALPHSRITQSEITASYDARSGWHRLWPTLQVSGTMQRTQVYASDLKPLTRLPEKMDLGVKISTRFVISPTYISLKNLNLSSIDNELELKADATLYKNQGRFTDYHVALQSLTLTNAFSTQAIGWFKTDSTLIGMAQRAGNIALNGHFSFRPLGKSEGQLNIKTNVGLMAARATWKGNDIRSTLKLTNVAPATLLANPKLPHLVTLGGNLNLNLKDKKLACAKGNIDVTTLLWNNYSYQHIALKGNYTDQNAQLHIECNDPNAEIHAKVAATLQNHKLNNVAMEGKIGRLAPALLGLHTPYGEAVFTAETDIDLKQIAELNPEGHFIVKNFSMANAPQGDYKLNKLEAHLQKTAANVGQLNIDSDFLNLTLHGPLSPAHLTNGLNAILQRCLPGLVKKPINTVAKTDKWKIQANFTDAEVLRKMLNLKIELDGPIHLQGNIDATGARSALSVFTSGLRVNGQAFGNPSIYLHGQDKEYQCLVKANRIIANKPFDIVANLHAHDSVLTTRLDWKATNSKAYQGAIYSDTQFFSGNHAVNFNMNVHPTQFTLDGTIWNVGAGSIALMNREVTFNHISVSHQEQALTINGRLSPQQNDSIVADLRSIDINYILGLVNFHAVEFGGQATGKAVFTKSAEHPELNARLHIPDFTFNNGPMGDSYIIGSWSPRDNRILLDADMHLPQGKGAGTKVNGYVSLAEKGLKLDINANQTDLRFLRGYMAGIFDRFNGEATGQVQLHGPFKALDFNGEVTAKASARILATGVEYSIDGGKVHFRPGEFAFEDFTVNDGLGGIGKADGYLRHTHLKNLNYAFDLNAEHLLCYDCGPDLSLPFYSTTTGSGKVHLQGGQGRFTADINLRPEAPTTLTYTLGTADAMSADDSMIRFGKLDSKTSETGPNTALQGDNTAETEETESQESTTDIVLNFLIDANPAAEVRIVTDPRTGDVLTAYGEGPIRARFHNKGNFEMYGTYHLTRGSYKISLQDIIRKDLTLQRGSTLTFSGNPLEADLGLRALYTVNGVSLSDLNYGAGFSQKSARVDCILNIGGKAKAPQVNFDLDLHNISDDEKQMVRQLIATDEDMNRQVIYLLGIGRFYTTNTQSSVGQSSTQQQSAAAMRSFLSTTLTGQLNTAIQSALGNKSHWSFGTNVAPGTMGWSDIEVDGLLQGRLFNDRLLINGNFGYRDRPTYTSNFVGDFDIRYLLNPKGSVSLRAYSETTDRYFTKSSLTTQGVGITLQREFNSLRDLFNTRKRKQKKAERKKNKVIQRKQTSLKLNK